MKYLPTASYLTAIYLFFYIPIIVLIVYSFNNAQYSLLWHGFSFRWYYELFADTDLWIAVSHSLILGVLAATIAMCIGSLAAISLYRYVFWGRNVLYGLIFILILSPDIVMGISLLILFSLVKVPLGFGSLLLAHITFCIPFVVVTVYSRIVSFDHYIFEAAKDLGATDTVILTRVILPLLWPALLAGWLLSFTLSLDDVIISYFVAGPDFEILPLKIYSMVRLGVKPEINALCSVTFMLTLILIIISQLSLRKKL
ncbi:MAG: Spermidine/putrescine transport system permease protein PotC [uncultured bacterium]|nr:MAG: Spermidine/putrescine transport system permease protein PotC [uncultured bacterium]